MGQAITRLFDSLFGEDATKRLSQWIALGCVVCWAVTAPVYGLLHALLLHSDSLVNPADALAVSVSRALHVNAWMQGTRRCE